ITSLFISCSLLKRVNNVVHIRELASTIRSLSGTHNIVDAVRTIDPWSALTKRRYLSSQQPHLTALVQRAPQAVASPRRGITPAVGLPTSLKRNQVDAITVDPYESAPMHPPDRPTRALLTTM